MLTIEPVSALGWNCRVVGPLGNEVAWLELSSWRMRGTVETLGERYIVRREGWFGPLVLDGPAGVAARARRAFSLRSAWFIEYRDRQFLLEQPSLFSRDLALYEGREVIGQITTGGMLSRRGRVDLPEFLHLPFRMFLAWLAVSSWRARADTNASG